MPVSSFNFKTCSSVDLIVSSAFSLLKKFDYDDVSRDESKIPRQNNFVKKN